MDAQELLLQNALRVDLPETIEQILNDFIRISYEAIGVERNMDGNGVQALIERSLTLVNQAQEHLGRPELCVLCPELHVNAERLIHLHGDPYDRNSRYGGPKSTSLGFMELRCGHRLHTQCYLNGLAHLHVTPLRSKCGICETSILEQSAIDYFRDTDPNPDGDVSVIRLWETNPEFRNGLKELRKERSKCVTMSRGIYSQMKVFKDEFVDLTQVSVNTIRMYKKEFQKKMNGIANRRSVVYYNSLYSRKLKEFCKKYKIWSSSLRQLRTMNGGPRMPRCMGIPWKYRFPVGRMLRVRIV
jgi:hypothetical protein